ncbi:reverse transcriptase domain-containing protein, partial [Tanacetum coccineum]
YDDRSIVLWRIARSTHRGLRDAIVIPENHLCELLSRSSLVFLNLVQNKLFFGTHDKEDPHAPSVISNKDHFYDEGSRNVPNTSVKLIAFTVFSRKGQPDLAGKRKPPRSIETWDDLVSKFINKFFPPFKTTNLRNEITRFQQKFDETFYEAWDRFNDLLRGCPHHGFSELHQLDTFYNALNSNVSRFIELSCSVASSNQAVSSDVACTQKDMVSGITFSDRKNQTHQLPPRESGFLNKAAAANFNQANSGYRPPMVSNQIRPPGFPPVQNPHANNQNNSIEENNFNKTRGKHFNKSGFIDLGSSTGS